MTSQAAERSFEPLAAKSSHLVSNSPPCSSLSLSTNETAANTVPVTTKPLQGARVSHLAGSFRTTRSRSTTRALDTAAMLDETLSLFVEATGKDEASMRQQLMSKRQERVAAESGPVEDTRGREATPPHQEEGSVGVLQEVAKLETKEAG